MKRFLCVFFVILLFGCAKDGISFKTIENSSDTADIRAEYVVLGGVNPNELETELNEKRQSAVDERMKEFEALCADSSAALRAGNKAVFETEDKVHYNKNNFLSYVSESYTYLGGAHGTSEWEAHNIDFDKGMELKLADLFCDDSYSQTLLRCMNEIMDANEEEYRDLWAKPYVEKKNQGDFYISEGRLILYYPPYELSYYARGTVEFPISLTELRGVLKEEYKRLI